MFDALRRTASLFHCSDFDKLDPKQTNLKVDHHLPLFAVEKTRDPTFQKDRANIAVRPVAQQTAKMLDDVPQTALHV